MKEYKISVHRPHNKTFTYTVDYYNVINGTLIEFVDRKTGVTKQFDSRLLEIEVLDYE